MYVYVILMVNYDEITIFHPKFESVIFSMTTHCGSCWQQGWRVNNSSEGGGGEGSEERVVKVKSALEQLGSLTII